MNLDPPLPVYNIHQSLVNSLFTPDKGSLTTLIETLREKPVLFTNLYRTQRGISVSTGFPLFRLSICPYVCMLPAHFQLIRAQLSRFGSSFKNFILNMVVIYQNRSFSWTINKMGSEVEKIVRAHF